MPALLTSVSMRPHLAITPSTMRAMLSLSVTSMTKPADSPPISAIFATVSWIVASLMSQPATLAPSWANLTAVACPMPWPAPVMIETLPLSRMVFPDRWTVSAPLECGDSILFHCIAQPGSWQAQHGPLFPKRPIINNGLIAIARRPVQAAGAGRARRCDAMHEAAGLAAEAQRKLRGRQPMLDHQLQRVESLVVIDLGPVGGADARRQRLGPLEENGVVAPFVERERELQMLVA